jgi:PAS domain S-box-containing protein
LIAPTDGVDVSISAGELHRVGHWEGEFDVIRKDGSSFPAYVRDRIVTSDDGSPAGIIGVSVDMSERVAAQRELLATRNYLQAVTDSVSEGLYTADTEGRLTYMNEAAERMLGWSWEEAKGRVMHDLAHCLRPDGSDLPIAECPILRTRRDGESVHVEDEVFVCRDGSRFPVAYTASPFSTEDGVQGCVVAFEDVSERRAREARLQRDVEKLAGIERIQEALAEERFLLYAQPIVDLRTGAVAQQELLLRVREAGGEIVGPASYLPIAEEYGLVGDIDRWVIQRAAEIAASSVAIHVNVSARSIGDQTIVAHIEHCLQQTGADPSLIVFEITETALVADEAAAVAFAEQLHCLGCKLALDDFGTGYGTFTYLKHLPVDYRRDQEQLDEDQGRADTADLAHAVKIAHRQSELDRDLARGDARQDQLDQSQTAGDERQGLLDRQQQAVEGPAAVRTPTAGELDAERAAREQRALERVAGARRRAQEAVRRAEAAEARAQAIHARVHR